MDLPGAISALSESRDLSGEEMREVVSIVMRGEATPAQIGAFLTALHIKGETVVELVAAARVMRQFAAVVDVKSEKIVVVSSKVKISKFSEPKVFSEIPLLPKTPSNGATIISDFSSAIMSPFFTF